MKSIIKTFLTNNMLELSTWIGFIILVREMFAVYPSAFMSCVALILILVPDSAIRNFIAEKAKPIKDLIEKW